MGVDIDWGGFNASMERNNAGRRWQEGWQEGEKRAQENALKAAMTQYATNPDDPNAINALAQVDPQAALVARGQQQTRAAEISERHRADIMKGAQLVRQMKPQDQAGWQRVLATAGQLGIDLSEVPQQFDPQYVESLIAAADTFNPSAVQQPTTMQRDYEFLNARDPKLGESYLNNKANPPRFMPDGAGGFIAVDPGSFSGPTGPAASAGGGPAPGTVEDGFRFKGGDPARQENWEPVAGGQTVAPSGTFQR